MCAIIALRAPIAEHPNLRRVPPSYVPSKQSSLTGFLNFSEAGIVKRAMSEARVYADVNVFRPREYWDYDSFTVQWG